ncbi:hypothetical protein QFC22_004665 [Naganishia vaughanmartiniae]|uniref:Uncharacterized protein n=1 Tax=Naganishia vaughanmartiniae TaxID=1424756 RepID=A0ACC2WZE0_9TREE|nr:hypothetical protein QFC22_004665 [Naganishia vaughanmartiniae]
MRHDQPADNGWFTSNSVTSSVMSSGPAATESAGAFSSWKSFSTLVMKAFTSSAPIATILTEHSQTTKTDNAGPIPSASASPAASYVRLETEAPHSTDSPSRTNDGNRQQQPTETGHDEEAYLHYDAIANILFINQSLSADDHATFEPLFAIHGKKNIAINGTEGTIALENALLFRIGGSAPLPALVTEAKRVGGFRLGPRIRSYQLEWVINKVYQTQKLPEICLPTFVHRSRLSDIVQKIQGTFEKVELTMRSLKDIEQRNNDETLRLQQNNEKLEAEIEHIIEIKAQLNVKEEYLMQWEANLEGVLEPYLDIILIESCLIAFLIFLLFKHDPFITSIRTRLRRSKAMASSGPRNAPATPQDPRSRSCLSRIVSSCRRFNFTAVLHYYIPTMSTITRSPVAYVISVISLFHFVKLTPAMKTATKWVKKLFYLRLWESNKTEATSSVQSRGKKGAARKPTSRRLRRTMRRLTYWLTTSFKGLVSLLHLDLLIATFFQFAYQRFKILIGIRDTTPKRSGRKTTSKNSKLDTWEQATSTATQRLTRYLTSLELLVHVHKSVLVMKTAVKWLKMSFSLRPWPQTKSGPASVVCAAMSDRKSEEKDVSAIKNETPATTSAVEPPASSDVVVSGKVVPDVIAEAAEAMHEGVARMSFERDADANNSTTSDGTSNETTGEDTASTKGTSPTSSPPPDDSTWTEVVSKKRTKVGAASTTSLSAAKTPSSKQATAPVLSATKKQQRKKGTRRSATSAATPANNAEVSGNASVSIPYAKDVSPLASGTKDTETLQSANTLTNLFVSQGTLESRQDTSVTPQSNSPRSPSEFPLRHSTLAQNSFQSRSTEADFDRAFGGIRLKMSGCLPESERVALRNALLSLNGEAGVDLNVEAGVDENVEAGVDGDVEAGVDGDVDAATPGTVSWADVEEDTVWETKDVWANSRSKLDELD